MGGEETAYERFAMEERVLRDELAIDRTVLANERTFLAYARTALACGAVGGTVVEVFRSLGMQSVGVVFLLLGGLVFIVGVRRTQTMSRRIRTARKKFPPEAQQAR